MLTQACMLLGRYPEALRAVDQALVLLRLRGDRRERAELQSMRVEVLTQLERWPEAREVGLRALATFEALDHTKGLIRIRMALADLATQLDQPREALRHYRQVEWLLPADAPRRVRAVIATNRGSALQACNRFRAATRWFELARELFLEEGCEHSTAHLDYNLAHAAFKRGRFAEALERFDDVAPTLERLQDEMHRAHVDLDRAEIHLRLHLPEDARAYAERAGERFEALGLTRDRAQAAYVAGRASALGGEYHAATELFARARKAFAALAMSGREVSCLVQTAYAWLAMERPAQAAALASESASLLTAFSNPLTAASVRLLEASLAMAAGNHEAARETAAGVLESTRRIFAPWLRLEALRTVGEACRALDRAPEALEALRAALAIVEQTRGEVPPDAYRSAYSSAGAELYETLVDLLLDSGDVQGAFEHAQRAKSRTLLEQLGRSRPAAHGTLCDTRIDALRASLNAVYSELLRDGVRDDGAPEQRLARNRQAAELEQTLARVLRQRRGTPIEDPAAASLPSVAAIQAALAPDSRLLEYFQTPRGLVVFVVTAEDLAAGRAPAAPGELEECSQRLRFPLAKHERPELVA
ncbi:MAG: hypothetical protein P1V36_04555, partial [Planctomycetota bacterium]|nr:hypothetical protein [Planctomycetota bacterium]